MKERVWFPAGGFQNADRLTLCRKRLVFADKCVSATTTLCEYLTLKERRRLKSNVDFSLGGPSDPEQGQEECEIEAACFTRGRILFEGKTTRGPLICRRSWFPARQGT